MMTTLYERELRDKEMARLFAQEELIDEATELIATTMGWENISKSELALRIGSSKAYVTQLLAGSRNMTLRTFADLMHAMDRRVLLTSTSVTEDRDMGTTCWAVKAPRPITPHTWEDAGLFIGTAGEVAA